MLADKLPRFGVGVAYFSGIDPLLESASNLIDVLEIEPQTIWYQPDRRLESYRVDEEALAQLVAYPFPKTIHGIGFPVGGSRPPHPGQMPPLLEMIGALEPPWVSEHLSFNLAEGPEGEFKTAFLLPPRQTRAGVAAAVASVRWMEERLPVPMAVETGVNYLRPRSDELPDGVFVGTVVEEADCGVLLDLHNLWTNERNGREPVLEFLSQIPLERVWEVHIAGGSQLGRYWLDSHSGPAPEELLKLAGDVIPRLPNLRAIIFELFPDYLPTVGVGAVRSQLKRLHDLWEEGTSSEETSPAVGLHGRFREAMEESAEGPTPEEWENALGTLVVGQEANGSLAMELAADPGVSLLSQLLGEFRGSMVTGVLKLTTRLLVLALGRDRFMELLQGYWREATPERFASAEGLGFAEYLEGQGLEVPHLSDVLRFERAMVATLLDNRHRIVPFGHDPLSTLRPLAEGRLPNSAQEGNFEVELTPDGDYLSSTDRFAVRSVRLPMH